MKNFPSVPPKANSMQQQPQPIPSLGGDNGAQHPLPGKPSDFPAAAAPAATTTAAAGARAPLLVAPSSATTTAAQEQQSPPLVAALAPTVPSTPASVLPASTFASGPVSPELETTAAASPPEALSSASGAAAPAPPPPLQPSLPPQTPALRLLVVGPASVGKRSLARGLLEGLEKEKTEGKEEEEESDEDEDEDEGEIFPSPPKLAVAGASTLPVSSKGDSVRVRVSCASSSSRRVLPALRACYARALAADASPRRNRRKQQVSSSSSSPPSSLLFDACLFLLPPHARPGPRDRAAFRALSELVPTIPVLAKADAMTPRELEETQRAVRRALFGSGRNGGGGTGGVASGVGGVGGTFEAAFPFSREALAAAGFKVDGFGDSASCLIVPDVCGARGGGGGGGGGGVGEALSSPSSSSRSSSLASQHPHSKLRELRSLLLGTAVADELAASSARFEAFREAKLLARRSGSASRRSRDEEEEEDKGGSGGERVSRRGSRASAQQQQQQQGIFFASACRVIGLGRPGKGRQRGEQQQREAELSRRRRRSRSRRRGSSSSPSPSSSVSESDEGGYRTRYHAQRSSENYPASLWSRLFTPIGRALGFREERRAD